VADATHQAYQLINASVDKQSYYLAYLDTFHLIGIFFIVVLPLLFFMKAKKKTPADSAAAKAAMDAAH
jgi:DHA2 family multidrug resistance protein